MAWRWRYTRPVGRHVAGDGTRSLAGQRHRTDVIHALWAWIVES